jgi:hypothetical protein
MKSISGKINSLINLIQHGPHRKSKHESYGIHKGSKQLMRLKNLKNMAYADRWTDRRIDRH